MHALVGAFTTLTISPYWTTIFSLAKDIGCTPAQTRFGLAKNQKMIILSLFRALARVIIMREILESAQLTLDAKNKADLLDEIINQS